jgi:YVTN family beta-propeller protein
MLDFGRFLEGNSARPATRLYGLLRLALLGLLFTVVLDPAALSARIGPADAVRVAAAQGGGATAIARQLEVARVLEAPRATNVYAATLTGSIRANLADVPPRVYVPNSGDGTVDVIDPASFKVVDHYRVGAIPHHVAPAWDLSRLYVDNEESSTFTVLDPRSGRPAGEIPIPHPYNLYFTPDGSKAIVVVERQRQIEFRDPGSWAVIKTVAVPWPGVDHLDLAADGSYLLASTEWSGQVVKVSTVDMALSGLLNVGGLPIDVRLAPDGSVFFVSNQGRNGISVVDPIAMREVGFIPTGRGAHGLQVSRDTKQLYVSNRLEGTVSVIDIGSRQVVANWRTGGSPDMLQLSADGKQLWASGRFDGAVYVVDTSTGSLLQRIRVGSQPHGLSYFPNTGRVSLGHNGVYR